MSAPTLRAMTVSRLALKHLPGKANAGLRAEIRAAYQAWENSEPHLDDDGNPVDDIDGERAILNVGRRVGLTGSGQASLAAVAAGVRNLT